MSESGKLFNVHGGRNGRREGFFFPFSSVLLVNVETGKAQTCTLLGCRTKTANPRVTLGDGPTYSRALIPPGNKPIILENIFLVISIVFYGFLQKKFHWAC